MANSRRQPEFHAFNPHADVRVYHRNLPHWRQDGATYFVTFRLGDSIPRHVLLKWQEEDKLWMKAHGLNPEARPGRGNDDANGSGEKHGILEGPEKLMEELARRRARRMHVELDQCRGSCLFRKAEARKVLAGALEHFHAERWWVGDYVIMPNHVHGLFQPIACVGAGVNGAEHRSAELENILASVKGYVSTRLAKLGLKKGRLWQQENYDRLVRDSAELAVWRKYIRRNPEKANLHSGEFSLYECDWL